MLDHFQSLPPRPYINRSIITFPFLFRPMHVYFFRFRERADAPYILDASAFPSAMTHCASNRSHCGHFLPFYHAVHRAA